MPYSKESLKGYWKRRAARKHAARGATIENRIGIRRLRILREENAGYESERPRTRAGCVAIGRPCPFVSCKYHLYLDVSPVTGSIKLNFPDLEPWEIKHTCALDVASKGGVPLEVIGEILNLTRERVRQLEVVAIRKLKRKSRANRELREAAP